MTLSSYWVGQKVRSGFPQDVTKTQKNILANPIHRIVGYLALVKFLASVSSSKKKMKLITEIIRESCCEDNAK